MKHTVSRRRILALGAAGATTLLNPFQSTAQAASSGSGLWPASIQLPDGFQPEGITISAEGQAYFGSLVDGSIYRAELATGHGSVISKGTGGMSLGLKINKSGRLFVAGGFSRELRVIDSISGRVLTAYTVGAQGTLVNDVVLTPKAAWFTDSYSAQLYAIPLGSNGELPSQGEVITRRLTGEWVQGPNHAANGIERTPDGCGLLMVNTHVGSLFRISPRTGYARQVVYDGPSLINGDGMLLQGRILYIVQKNVIDILRLDGSGSSAIHVGQITDPRFQIPTAVAAFRDRLYLPNARFDVEPTPTTTYNAIAVPRYS